MPWFLYQVMPLGFIVCSFVFVVVVNQISMNVKTHTGERLSLYFKTLKYKVKITHFIDHELCILQSVLGENVIL